MSMKFSPSPGRYDFFAVALAAIVLLGAGLAARNAAAESPCAGLRLQVTLPSTLSSITGTIECLGARSRASVTLYRFPDHLGSPEAQGLTDVNRYWLYPEGFDPGGMVVEEAASTGQGTSWRFTTTVPRRAGVLGRRRGVLYALDGWHPVPLPSDLSENRGPQPLPITYRVLWPANRVGLVGDRAVGSRPRARWIEGRFRGISLPLLLADSISLRKTPSGRSWLLTPAAASSPARMRLPHLRQFNAHLDVSANDAVISALTQAERELPRPVGGRPLLVIQAPLLHRFSVPFAGGFLLAERAFHVLPVKVMRRFHRAAVWRAALNSYWSVHLPRCTAISRHQGAALLAASSTQRMVDDEFGDHRGADELLKPFAIIPEIDAMVFAPQLPFVDAYYQAVDATPRVAIDADHRLWHSVLGQASGTTLYGKLVDRYGYGATQDFLRRRPGRVCEARGWQGLATDALEALRPWLGAYPAVDYRLMSPVALADGGTRVTVAAVANAQSVVSTASSTSMASAESSASHSSIRSAPVPVEPIVVEIEVDDGVGAEATTDGRLRRTRLGPGTVDFPVPLAAVGQIWLDPHNRLAERVQAGVRRARYNNTRWPEWRLLLNNISGLLALTNGELAISADITLKRDYDLEWRFDAAAFYNADSFGGALAVSRGLGQRLTPLRLTSRISLSLAAERLHRQSSGALAGDQLSLSGFFLYDSRISVRQAFRGRGVNLRLIGAVGQDEGGQRYAHAQLGAGVFVLQPTGDAGGVLVRLRGDVHIGAEREQNLLSIGGRYRGGRGYERDEARGTLRFIASVEHRHVLDGDAHTDLWGLLTYTGIHGALFADAIWLNASRRRTDCPGELFFDLGYGLRFFGDVLNIQPGTLQLDVAVPFGRCGDERGRPPFSAYLAFVQSFAVF